MDSMPKAFVDQVFLGQVVLFSNQLLKKEQFLHLYSLNEIQRTASPIHDNASTERRGTLWKIASYQSTFIKK